MTFIRTSFSGALSLAFACLLPIAASVARGAASATSTAAAAPSAKIAPVATAVPFASGVRSAALDEASFKTPPASSQPFAWWHWMNGHISREQITRDLEAIKRGGMNGFMLWNAAEGTPPGPVKYFSPEWWRLLEHTMSEAERLGLTMGMHNGAGWSSSGGPWVTPDRAMQEVVWTELRVSGPGEIDQILTMPEPALGLERDMKKDPKINRRYYVDRESVRGYYRDIALFAFPTLSGDASGKPHRLAEWRLKAGFGKLRDRQPRDARPVPQGNAIDAARLVDLTGKLDAAGRLKWQVPPGDWTILRMGYQPTGRQNHPAPIEGRGLEISKLSADAVDFFWDQSIARFVRAAGPRVGKVFTYLEIDSFEVGHQNWSATLAEDFRRLRGYDLHRHLPALTGRIVGSADETERFLWDFRKTIGDLIAENYQGRMAALCRKHGLQLAIEPYGSYGNTDDFTVAGHADIPTCEWWAGQYNAHHTATARLAASAAHTHGRKIVDAEAFTGNPARIFEEHPFSMKAQGDFMFCQGVNRFSFHTFAHDPYGVAPGLGLGTYGGRFDTRNTWWEQGQSWREYIARCQHLLQQGEFVADLLYYAGEDAPQWCRTREELDPQPPQGIDFDVCSREILGRLVVREGRLVTPAGLSYRMLVLPPVSHMRTATLRTLDALVAAGAVVVGPKPTRLPGLEGGAEAERELKALADGIWGPCDGKSVTSQAHGKGRLCWGRPLAELCRELELTADFAFTAPGFASTEKTLHPGSGVDYIHRRIGGADVYFVSNQHHKPKVVQASFRVGGLVPELWDPVRGRVEDAPEFSPEPGGRTRVTLRLAPAGSVFVVFRRSATGLSGVVSLEKDGQSVVSANTALRSSGGRLFLTTGDAGVHQLRLSDGGTRRALVPALPSSQIIEGPWQVSFPPGRGVPAVAEFPRLVSWTAHADPEIRHFSGTAAYRIEVNVPADWLGKNRRVRLELGEVQLLPEVLVNGSSQGVWWTLPHAGDVTAALKPGRNSLEIRVTNLWVNRLIGDQAHPDDAEWTTETGSTAPGKGLAQVPDWVARGTPRPSPLRRAFVGWQWPHLVATKPLLPSGLLGPVRLVPVFETVVE